MDLFRNIYQKKIKELLLLFCTCIFVAIAYEGTSLSADLSQENLEQVNERLNRLENKVEDISTNAM